LLTTSEELIGEVKTGGSLGCSDHALVEFMVSRGTCQAMSVAKNINLRKVNFQFLKGLVDGTPWETALRSKAAQETWPLFKGIFVRGQER